MRVRRRQAEPPPRIELNLLPEEYSRRRWPVKSLLLLLLIMVGALAFTVANFLAMEETDRVSQLKADLRRLEGQAAQLERLAPEGKALRATLDAKTKRLEELKKAYATFIKERVRWAPLAEVIATGVREGVVLSSIAEKDTIIVVTGVVREADLVLQYGEHLKNSGKFPRVVSRLIRLLPLTPVPTPLRTPSPGATPPPRSPFEGMPISFEFSLGLR